MSALGPALFGILWIASAVISGIIADQKGRNWLGWAALGLFFGPLAVLVISAVAADPARSKPVPKELGAGMRLALDLGPLVLFFVANAKFGIFAATGLFMTAIVAAMIASYVLVRHVSAIQLFSAFMVLVMGGLTIWLHDATFIKLKPTIYYTLVAGLLAFALATGRPLLKTVLGGAYPGLDAEGWRKLTRNWALFFAIMAIANEAVWRNTSTDVWISYKLWGAIPATLLFALANVPMLMRHGLNRDEAVAASEPAPVE